MRYVSGLLFIAVALGVLATTAGPLVVQRDTLLVSVGIAIVLLMQGVFNFLPSSLATRPSRAGSSRWRKLWKVGIITQSLWGLVFMIIAAQLLTRPDERWSGLILMLIFSLPILGGAFDLNRIYQQKHPHHQPSPDLTELEIRLIQAAAHYNGECNLLELVAHSGISRERVEQLLDSLSRDDLVSIYVDEQGQTFYRFHQLFEAHKARRDILDEEPVLFDHDGESQQQHTIKQPAAHTSKR